MTNNPLIKVCGMRDTENIRKLVELDPDYIGFILYPKSQRYLGDDYILEAEIPESISRVGVFVDSVMPDIFRWINRLSLDVVQLHGSESPEYCKELKNMGIRIVKAFGVDASFDFSILDDYSKVCDYFLFDTKTPLKGGSGKHFNWNLLSGYQLDNPFFLSGGIGPEMTNSILKFNSPQLFAVDVNSQFETKPGIKNIEKLNGFFNKIRK